MEQRKTIKFKSHLANLILNGEKTTTWRLFDEKESKSGYLVELINSDTGNKFAKAEILKVWEKTLGTIDENDLAGHEKFESEQEMYETYKSLYGDGVDKNTVVKIIQFKLL